MISFEGTFEDKTITAMKYFFFTILLFSFSVRASPQTPADSGKSPWRLPFTLTFSATYEEHTLSGVFDLNTSRYDTIFVDTTSVAELQDGIIVYDSTFTPDTLNYYFDRFMYGSCSLSIIFVHGVDSISSLTFSFDTTFNGNRSGFHHTYSFGLFGLRYDNSSIICPDSSLAHATFYKSFDDGTDIFLTGKPYQTHVTSVGLLSMTLGGIIRPSTLSVPARVARSYYDSKLLLQSFPNPFPRLTTIHFASVQDGYANLTIFDLLGNEVANLYSGELTPGHHSFTWEPKGIAPGMYECVVRMNGTVHALPILLKP